MDAVTDPTTFLIVGGAGVLIPLVVSFLAKVSAGPVVKSAISVVLAGLTAGGAAVAGVADIGSDWKQVVGATLVAVTAAGASLAAVWSKTATSWIESHFPGGVG